MDIIDLDDNHLTLELGGQTYSFTKKKNADPLVMTDGDKNFVVQCSRTGQGTQVNIGSLEAFVDVPTISRAKKSQTDGDGTLKSPMPGNIYKIFVREGDPVKKGDKILILEAMKMEHTLVANRDGRVAKLLFSEGDQVEGDVELAVIAADESAKPREEVSEESD